MRNVVGLTLLLSSFGIEITARPRNLSVGRVVNCDMLGAPHQDRFLCPSFAPAVRDDHRR